MRLKRVTIETRRLLLRPYRRSDATALRALVSDERVACWTFIPHPYEAGMAEQWIAGQAEHRRAGTELAFALALKPGGELVGTFALLQLNALHRRAEIGYWLAPAHWGRGLTAEAGRAVIRHAFETLDLHRINAWHFAGNPASGRVMRKMGMTREGRMKEHCFRHGRFHDAVLYGITNPAHRLRRACTRRQTT